MDKNRDTRIQQNKNQNNRAIKKGSITFDHAENFTSRSPYDMKNRSVAGAQDMRKEMQNITQKTKGGK